MSAARTPVTVDFFADLTCPWCYVGWSALKRAAAEKRERIAAHVAWRTFMLAPDTPAEGLDRASYLSERFPPERLAAAHAALNAAAAATETPLNLDAAIRIPNTRDAHRLVHWAAQDGVAEPVIDALFHAYFVEGRDIGARAELLRVAENAGLDPQETAQRLSSAQDQDVVLGFHTAAMRLGITGVPVAIFNRKIPVMGAETSEHYGEAFEAAAR